MEAYLHYLAGMTASILRNTRRIGALAVFQYKLSNKEMFLGRLWKLIMPFVQIGVYWLVFREDVKELQREHKEEISKVTEALNFLLHFQILRGGRLKQSLGHEERRREVERHEGLLGGGVKKRATLPLQSGECGAFVRFNNKGSRRLAFE